MTLTEGGYFVNPSTNEFDPSAKDIQHDIQYPEDPQTVFGIIVLALKTRKEQGMQPFTVLSCDNLPHNGDVARQAILGLAQEIDTDLAQWIQRHVRFPNSMVDRITPATSDDLLKQLHHHDDDGSSGDVLPYYDDQSPVFCEPFRQWIIEDKFSNDSDRFPMDLCDNNVRFVKDVTPWENAKLRILNGGHAAMSYPAALLGMQYVHEAMEEGTVIDRFVDKLEKTEIVPFVDEVPDTNLNDYWNVIHQRYQNTTLSDSIDRNCEHGSDRQPKFILPSIEDCLKNEDNDKNTVSPDGLATVSAMWCKYCLGKTEAGDDITDKIQDDLWEKLHETAQKAAKGDTKAWLVDLEDVYGEEVGQNETFQKAFDKAFQLCMEEGVEAAMKHYLGDEN